MASIINCSSYTNGKKGNTFPLEDISTIIKEPDTFIWLGLHEPEIAMFQKIEEEFGLHELAVEDTLNAHQLPKIELYGDHLFIVVKTAQMVDGTVAYGETHFFVGPTFIVTIRHGSSTSYENVREFCESKPKLLATGPGFALYAVLDFIVDHYKPILEHFEAEFDQLEENIFKNNSTRTSIEKLYELKRQIITLRNAALPLDDICSQLMRFHQDIIHKDLQVYFRDIRDHLTRLISKTDTLRDMITAAMQVHLGFIAVGQNDVVKKLAGWGAILALPTVVFSLYGMNFQFMPELSWRFGYPAILIITFVGCFWLYYKLKKADWF
jgi:magnesium transporter